MPNANTPLTIWTNQRYPDAQAQFLRQHAAPHRIAWSEKTEKSNLASGHRDPATAEADVLYGQPHPEDILASERVRWVQLTTAGYTNYDNSEFKDALRKKGVVFCNASSLYDEPCAQHAAAMLLSMARAMPMAHAQQAKQHWGMSPVREKSLLLGGQRLLIIGYGSIARRLVELLAPFRFDVTAFRRSVRGDENCPTQPIDQIDAHLPDADIVINILPASEATRQFFDASRFDRLKRGAIYINIGRGDTTDQDALMSALNAGQVSQAFLDVTSPEPLPADHPLWQTPGCHITPHTAGGTRDEPQRMADYFLANLKRFASGEEPVNRLV